MTRENILDAAAKIFGQKGYHGTSMQDIADAVGLKKASLYYHISSKQEILLALLDQALDLLIEQIQAATNHDSAPPEKLQRAMRTYLQILADNSELAAVLLIEHRSLSPELHSRHIPRRDRFERLWRDLIQEGVDTGAFHCVDTAQATRALLGLMNWTITWYHPEGVLSPTEISDQFAGIMLNGLLTRNGET
ncbi:MAG: TetR/AcrR family transcriptional regulator [Chloroflexota bacterium]|nr:TetR/AcrR family transcriptional regulator [Chloroflexota bacterium]